MGVKSGGQGLPTTENTIAVGAGSSQYLFFSGAGRRVIEPAIWF